MLASELITQLTELIEVNGDLPVAFIYEDYLGDCYPVTEISDIRLNSVADNRIDFNTTTGTHFVVD